MELLTKEIEEKLPKFMEGDGTALVKFVLPDTKWKWYVCEYDTEAKTFYGLIEGEDKKWGKFTLEELQSLKGPKGVLVAIDEKFTPRKMK